LRGGPVADQFNGKGQQATLVPGLRLGLRVAVVHGVLDGAMQRDLQPHQLLRAGGAEINRSLRALRDGVHAGAAGDRAHIERSPRVVFLRVWRQRRLGQHGQRRGQRDNWVRRARVGEAVPAGTGDGDPIAAAAQRLRYSRLRARAVQHNVRGDAAGERGLLIKEAHAAQVAFAFLAYIAEKDQRRG
jgi:hypothetical protein